MESHNPAMFQTTNQYLTFSILFLLAGFTDSPMAPGTKPLVPSHWYLSSQLVAAPVASALLNARPVLEQPAGCNMFANR